MNAIAHCHRNGLGSPHRFKNHAFLREELTARLLVYNRHRHQNLTIVRLLLDGEDILNDCVNASALGTPSRLFTKGFSHLQPMLKQITKQYS